MQTMEPTSIDGLFQQIINSEQAAQRRKDQLNECKQNVLKSQENVKSLQKECTDLYKKLDQKLSELSEKELTFKTLKIQERIFEQQKDELKQQIHGLVQKKDEMQVAFFDKQTQFCEEIEKICGSLGQNRHGLLGEGTDKYSEDLADLLKQETELKTGLHQYNEKKAVIDQLTEERQAVQSQLDATVTEYNKVESRLYDVLEESEQLEAERQTLADQPHTGHNFLTLQRDLEGEKELACHLDEELSNLQAELQSTHQRLWQKQRQQRQQQQQAQLQQKQDHAGTRVAMVGQNNGSLNMESPLDEWDGSDMELIMDTEFTDEDRTETGAGAGAGENVQPCSSAATPASRKSIFKAGNKPPRLSQDS